MTTNIGQLVVAPINTVDSQDQYPTHIDTRGQGGYRAVADVPALAAIKSGLLSQGMWARTLNIPQRLYELESDLTTWTPVTFGVPTVLLDDYFDPTTDATTNWTPAFKRAIADLSAQGGGTITALPNKTYQIGKDGIHAWCVQWASNINLICDSWTTIFRIDPAVAQARVATFDTSPGTFIPGEPLTGTNGTGTATTWNASTNTLTFLLVSGYMKTGDTITGTTSGASGVTSSVGSPTCPGFKLLAATKCAFSGFTADGGRTLPDVTPTQAATFFNAESGTYILFEDIFMLNVHGTGFYATVATDPVQSHIYLNRPTNQTYRRCYAVGCDRDCFALQSGGDVFRYEDCVAIAPTQKAFSLEPETLAVQGTISNLVGTVAIGDTVTQGALSGRIEQYLPSLNYIRYAPSTASLGRFSAGTVTDTTTGATFTFSNLQDVGAIHDIKYSRCVGYGRPDDYPQPFAGEGSFACVPPLGSICDGVVYEDIQAYAPVFIFNTQQMTLINPTIYATGIAAQPALIVRNQVQGLTVLGGYINHGGASPAGFTDGAIYISSDIANQPCMDIQILGTKVVCSAPSRSGIVVNGVAGECRIRAIITMSGQANAMSVGNFQSMPHLDISGTHMRNPLGAFVGFMSLNGANTLNLISNGVTATDTLGGATFVYGFANSVAPVVTRPWIVTNQSVGNTGIKLFHIPSAFYIQTAGTHSAAPYAATVSGGLLTTDSAAVYVGYGPPGTFGAKGSQYSRLDPTGGIYVQTANDGAGWQVLSLTPVPVPGASSWPALISGRYYSANLMQGNTTSLVTENLLYAMPFFVPTTTTFQKIAISVFSGAADATCAIKLGIYADNGSGQPGALVLDAGFVVIGTTTGEKAATISQSLTPGWYWLATIVNRNGGSGALPTLRMWPAASLGAIEGRSTADVNGGFAAVLVQTPTWGTYALPNPFGTAATSGNPTPALALQVS